MTTDLIPMSSDLVLTIDEITGYDILAVSKKICNYSAGYGRCGQ
jgi:hypothetical protein